MIWYADYDAAGKHAMMLVLPPGRWSINVYGKRFNSSFNTRSKRWFTIPFAFPPEEGVIRVSVSGDPPKGMQPSIIAIPGVPIPFLPTKVIPKDRAASNGAVDAEKQG